MLTGKGDQYWMTKKYESKRQRALEDRTRYDSAELENLDIESYQGTGETDDDNFTVDTYPFPIDKSIRGTREVDLRKVDPRIGD